MIPDDCWTFSAACFDCAAKYSGTRTWWKLLEVTELLKPSTNKEVNVLMHCPNCDLMYELDIKKVNKKYLKKKVGAPVVGLNYAKKE